MMWFWNWVLPTLVNTALCYYFFKRGFSRGWDACADALPVILPAIMRLSNEGKNVDEIKLMLQDPKANPYRTPVKLPVVQEEREKVYCKDCKHVDYEYPSWKEDPLFKFGTPFCWLGEMVDHPVRGKYRARRSVEPNNNFDCKDYEARSK